MELNIDASEQVESAFTYQGPAVCDECPGRRGGEARSDHLQAARTSRGSGHLHLHAAKADCSLGRYCAASHRMDSEKIYWLFSAPLKGLFMLRNLRVSKSIGMLSI